MAGKLTKKELKRYVEEQLDSGHHITSITEHLLKYGHSREEIDAIIEDILDEEEIRKRSFIKRAAELLFVVLFVMFILWVGASSDSPGEAVFVGFLPTIVFIILSFVVVEKRFKKDLLVVLPLIIGFLFYISGTLSSISIFENLEIAKLTLLNLILSYVFVLFIRYSELFGRIKIPGFDEDKIEEFEEEKTGALEKLRKEFTEPGEEEQKKGEYITIPEKHESLKKIVESIESNCKALNSAIGRVYRKSNGGTRLVRELIEVKSEWYNSFNYLLKNLHDRQAISDLVERIEKRLNVMFRKEHELFGTTQFRNLKRDPNGNSRIIDVLIMNDNDPVQTYFENALKACGEAKEIIGGLK